MTQTDALDEFLIRVHNETFAVSGMIFRMHGIWILNV